MGIGGSGLSGVAVMAKKAGYEVDGCDIEKETPYLGKVKKAGIKIYYGHSPDHLKDTDLLVISPSVVFQNSKHLEYKGAKEKKIVKPWDEFVGEYLLKGKKVICIAGTHGKSTTTALSGLIFEAAGTEPNVLVGATVHEWGANYRIGESDLFIIESDEFYDKFLSYGPQIIILNNIEFDHPDYFKDEKKLIESFRKFVESLQGDKILIINLDSSGIQNLFTLLGKKTQGLKVYGYTLKQNSTFKVKNMVYGTISKKEPEFTDFVVYSDSLHLDTSFRLKIMGDYNVSNSLGAIILAQLFNVKLETTREVLSNFDGIGRRLELIGEKKKILIYDDYAHHPTAIKATISALRQRYPTKRIWAIVEPHSYSRTKALLGSYKDVFDIADKVIVGPIFKARDIKKFGVDNTSIVKATSHSDIRPIGNLDEITKLIKREAEANDVVLVMGAGYSYMWAREILRNL